MAPVLTVPVPITRSCGSYPFAMNPYKTENSYFETQTQQRVNSEKPVSTNSLYTIYALF